MNETEDLKKFDKKIITPLIVLSATAIIALFTYFKHYPLREWLLIVLCCVVLFVAIALIFEKMIMRFMDVNREKALALQAEEENCGSLCHCTGAGFANYARPAFEG